MLCILLTEYKTATKPISNLSFQAVGSLTTVRENSAAKMVPNIHLKNNIIIIAGNFFRIIACKTFPKPESQHSIIKLI